MLNTKLNIPSHYKFQYIKLMRMLNLSFILSLYFYLCKCVCVCCHQRKFWKNSRRQPRRQGHCNVYDTINWQPTGVYLHIIARKDETQILAIKIHIFPCVINGTRVKKKTKVKKKKNKDRKRGGEKALPSYY